MDINKYIFREYYIRGKVAEDFPPDVVEALGKGFATYVKRNGGMEIALSGDVRLTTPSLIEYFKTGVLTQTLRFFYKPRSFIDYQWPDKKY